MVSALAKIPFLAMAAAAQSSVENIPTSVVVLTGMSLTFAILFLLIGVLILEGKIFSAVAKGKNKAAAPAAAPATAPAMTPAPVVEAGISPEVVAAITAAIHHTCGNGYTLRAISTAKQGRGQWGFAGVMQSVEPF